MVGRVILIFLLACLLMFGFGFIYASHVYYSLSFSLINSLSKSLTLNYFQTLQNSIYALLLATLFFTFGMMFIILAIHVVLNWKYWKTLVEGKLSSVSLLYCLHLFTLVYSCLLLFTFVYFCLYLFSFVYVCLLLLA